MDNGLFLDGYSRPAAHEHRRYEETPEDREMMEGPRKWGSFFDRQLVLYLKGAQGDDPVSIHQHMSDYYLNWLEPHLDATLRKAERRQQDESLESGVTNELNFHVLNRELFPMWYQLLLAEHVKPYDAKLLHTMQTRLAYSGATLVKQRQRLESSKLQPKTLDKLYGRTTEIDTAIVLLEVLKECLTGPVDATAGSQLIVLPGSPRFESGYQNHPHAADFVIIDPSVRQAHGIQVKTTMDKAKVRHHNENTIISGYSLDYVTMVDGATDLGNSRPDVRFPYYKAAPGLISLEYLRDHVTLKDAERNELLQGFKSEILRGKSIARELARNNKPYLHTATQQVGSRVLHDLYKQKNSPIESVSL